MAYEITPEVRAAHDAGDTALAVLIICLQNGCWAYPAGDKRQMTQDIETATKWHRQGVDVRLMKGYRNQ